MDDWKLPWDGGCRCGAVRLRVTKPPLIASACHCAGCRTMSASAFSLSLGLPADGLEIVRGAPVLAGLDADQHYFCPKCMTWLFTRPPALDWFVNLRATMLDDHGWFAPFMETYTNEKLVWAATGAKRSFATLPDPSEYGPLMEAYAAEGARP